MKNELKYPIGYVSRQTGLTAHQIRAWERRYAAVVPERTQSNRRLYSETDIVRLKLLTKARQSGLSLEQLAALSTEDLMRLINTDTLHPATPPAVLSARPPRGQREPPWQWRMRSRNHRSRESWEIQRPQVRVALV